MDNNQPLTDAELLDFDRSRLSDGDRIDFEAQLAAAGDRYRDHLMIANWIAGWEQRVADSARSHGSEDEDEAFRRALREVTAHLRQGDFLPGRVFYRSYGSAGTV